MHSGYLQFKARNFLRTSFATPLLSLLLFVGSTHAEPNSSIIVRPTDLKKMCEDAGTVISQAGGANWISLNNPDRAVRWSELPYNWHGSYELAINRIDLTEKYQRESAKLTEVQILRLIKNHTDR